MEDRPSLFARIYLRMSAKGERRGQAQHRARTLEGLSGRVIELGAGHGLNFPHYPPTVDEVVAVEPDPTLRSIAADKARSAPVPVRVVDGKAGSLPGSEGDYDAAVASLVLCTVPDPSAALRELRHLVRPGGELRFYEHVRSADPRFARMQAVVNTVWPKVGGGCNTNRRTAETIEAAGFEIESCDRFDFQPTLTHAPVKPHILGVARRP